MEGSGQSRSGTASPRIFLDRTARALPLVFGGAALAILVAKLLLAWRININWDEFNYLSHVHALARGELDLLLQTAYTHLFEWVVTSAPNEVDQVVSLRLPMGLLLALSAWLLFRLARRWASAPAAAFAVLAFVGSWPVLKHGAAFRADSMLLPLTLGALLLVTNAEGRRAWNHAGAGICLGVAFALTSKAVLLLPVLLAMVLLPDRTFERAAQAGSTRRIATIVAIAAIAALTFLVLIGVHSTQVVAGNESAGSFAWRSLMATLVDTPLIPRGHNFRALVTEDAVFWLAVLAGFLIAVRTRNYRAAGAGLALLPILFYRNAFPYYYPLMMAPASVLVALSADWVLGGSTTAPPRAPRLTAIAILGLLLMHDAWDGLMALRFDEQAKQRAVVAAVHRIFPEAVPYIDHGGMIASYPKANFFMSSWGVEHYLRTGRDFMPEALAKHRPPLLLVNHGVLHPGSLLFRKLREADRRLLASSYVDYWGPIRVAGVEASIPAGQVVRVQLPFPGRYRIESRAGIVVDGTRFSSGDTIDFRDSTEHVLETAIAGDASTPVRLVWAASREPPPEPPPRPPLYSPL